MFDANIICFLLEIEQIDRIREIFAANEDCELLERRKHIPHTLDKEMPRGGWSYTVGSLKQDPPHWELIHRHKLYPNGNGKLRPSSEITSYEAPYNFKIYSSASPALVLLSFYFRVYSRQKEEKQKAKAKQQKAKAKQQKCEVKDEGPNDQETDELIDFTKYLPTFWDEVMKGKAIKMLELAHGMSDAKPSTSFKDRPSGVNLRNNDDAEYVTEQTPHDYREWPNEPGPKVPKRPETPTRTDTYDLELVPIDALDLS
ncbi:hypothetical protein H0H87_010677 [Tephrocybe sp. NHM501043]|nr:hypothetical protein H0H87_010677 [Tephrocybe sp. NHM501043]